jgi:hypothetical protein
MPEPESGCPGGISAEERHGDLAPHLPEPLSGPHDSTNCFNEANVQTPPSGIV